MKFRTRIWLLPSAAAAIFIVGALVSAAIGLQTSSALASLQHEDHPFKEGVDRFSAHVDGFRAAVQAAATEGDRAKVDEARAGAATARQELQALARLSRHAAHAEALTKALDAYEPAAVAAAIAMTGGGDAGDAMKRMAGGKAALDRALADAAQAAAQAVEASQQAATRGVERSLAALALTGLVILATLAGASWWLIRSVWRDLGDEPETLRQRVQRIAAGELTAQALPPHIAAGSLLASVEAMRLQLSGIVAGIRGAADSIAHAAAEVASGNHDLSQRTERASANLEATASTTAQITVTVQKTAESSRQASALATEAREAATQGGTVVEGVVREMAAISDASRRIADITGVIDGIAFQTNILALNAAVEAARAGEQGRGFAVVAGEVRALAQRSAQAARQIGTLIGEANETVVVGTRRAGEAGASMAVIVGRVQRVSAIVDEITGAAEEQSSGIAHINESVGRLDDMTQQNAALVEQGSAAAAHLQEQAERLAGSVRAFTLDPAPAAAETTAA